MFALSNVFALLVCFAAVSIEFLTEFGDLPLLVPNLAGIRNTNTLKTLSYDYIMNITEYQQGMAICGAFICVSINN